MIKICNLCGGLVYLYNPSRIYGNKYKHFSDSGYGISASYVYQCFDCRARVGCHGTSKKPLGTLADKETRNARHLCHELLDPLWKIKQSGDYKTGLRGKKRKQLYGLLSKHMGISMKETHFGMFDIKQCRIAYMFFLKYKIRNKIK